MKEHGGNTYLEVSTMNYRLQVCSEAVVFVQHNELERGITNFKRSIVLSLETGILTVYKVIE
jgi:hypothetical protein